MGLFSRDSGDVEWVEPSAESTDDEEETVEVEEEIEWGYTEHHGTIQWNDGSTEEVVFDEMVQNDGCIILKDYVGLHLKNMGREWPGVEHRPRMKAWMSISLENLRTLTTDERVERTLTKTVTKEVLKSEVED